MPVSVSVTVPRAVFRLARRGQIRRAARWANRQSTADIRDELKRSVPRSLRRSVRSRSSGDKSRVVADWRARLVGFGTKARRTRRGAYRGRLPRKVDRDRLFGAAVRRWPDRFYLAMRSLIASNRLPPRDRRV